MSEQIKFIDVAATWRRVLLLMPLAVALSAVWFVGRWCMGNTLAEYPPDESAVYAAMRLAPDDPQTHFTRAVFARNNFTPEEMQEALRQYEQATSLAPNDYRQWLELGRARGQVGDSEGGARALRRAAELAPNYALPRWYLGNLLLRAGRQEEAFAELRRAAEMNPEVRTQVFALSWNVFGGDVGRIAEAVGDTPAARAELAEYLVKQKFVDDAVRLWSSLSAKDKSEQRASGERLMRALFEVKRYRAALDVYRGISPEGGAGVAPGQVFNGGFESDFVPIATNPFAWDMKSTSQAQMVIDPKNVHGGERSLRLLFNSRGVFSFNNVAQLVPVEPSTRYRLEFFARAADLKSVSAPVTEVVDNGESGRVLAVSAPVAANTQDWQQFVVDFTTPAQTEAVTVRLSRAPCPEGVCPIFGRVWYDDFSLQRIGGESGARASGGGADGDSRRGHAQAALAR